MISCCLRKYYQFLMKMVCTVCILIATIGTCESASNRCTSSSISSCNDCLYRGPECGWCFQEDFLVGTALHERCDLVPNLIKKGCISDFIESPLVKVVVNSTSTSSQVTPRDVSLHLRPGSEVNFILEVHQLERYPVDMYYLVDVSASMQESLDKLKSVGFSLLQKMEEFSSDFRLGFGSFVDKPVSPYINVHPPKIANPCSDYDIQCRPAHGYIHVLSLTENITEFTRVVQQQHISGNMDTPEGGFDAMFQAAVCQSHIGWRKEAKHLLLVMTDQPSHLALDSKLAGIVVPHDGNCHLVNNTYSETANMEHPTIGQLAEKLLENSIYSIFAVEGQQYTWYEDLIPLLPGTVVGKLESKASNLKELVVDAYKKLLSEVELQVESLIKGVSVNVTAICPEGSTFPGLNKCRNVKPNEKVLFNIKVGMQECHSLGDEAYIFLKPFGFNETTKVRIQSQCSCRCGRPAEHAPGRCLDEVTPQDCENCKCNHVEKTKDDQLPLRDCQADQMQPACSGRGLCLCGKCLCDQSSLGRIYGKYCERDGFSCPYHQGLLCGGHGQCISGKCECSSGWEGENCNCSVSTETCLTPDSQICSGRGKCVCGKCQCEDPRSSGQLCELCPTCESSCETNWKCVQCHLFNDFSETKTTQCNTTCSPLVHYVSHIFDSESETFKYCLYLTKEKCHYKFQMEPIFGEKQIQIFRYPECLTEQSYFPTFILFFILTVVIGIMAIGILKCIVMRKNRVKGESPVEVYSLSTKKDYFPTANEKTITYRRDRPGEMQIHIHKMPLNDV
ncbi:integrin beta-8-like [Acipenser oxyrinchus oxyrinchus]|uniref:Integrin beta n=1 Tax=Acipenser oxyrinchus oxyrinchus TaxID=40147 RepID=A0AAD8GF13_ACIOX|nr:integrin beta-8-like [Acipenser oxyrinchus oxyrinchus]